MSNSSAYTDLLSRGVIASVRVDLQEKGLLVEVDKGFERSKTARIISDLIARLYPGLPVHDMYQLTTAMSVIVRTAFGVSRVDGLSPEQFREALVLVGSVVAISNASMKNGENS